MTRVLRWTFVVAVSLFGALVAGAPIWVRLLGH